MKLSFSRSDLEHTLDTSVYSAERLVDLFRKDLKAEYDSRSYVWEEHADNGKWRSKYTIKGHSLRVLKQFEKYNSFNLKKLPLNIIDKNFFRIILVLHDVGVYKAVKEGAASKKESDLEAAKKKGQHKYTKQYIQSILPQLQFDQNGINLAVSIISGDPIGSYLKESIGRTEASRQIKGMSDILNMPIDQFFTILTIFYICDASSYTIDGEGKESLDRIFYIEKHKHDIMFNSSPEKKMQDLERNYINKIAKGAVPITNYEWYPMPVFPYWFQPGEIDSGIEKKENLFAYRKRNGRYEVRLRSHNKLPALFDPNYGR
jgi:hypothetical protein